LSTGDGSGAFTTGAGSGAFAITAGSGALAHAASKSSAMQAMACRTFADNRCNRIVDGEKRVGWVFFEIVLALVVAVTIVWWTLPKKRADKPPDDADGKS
jgi:hypothetical protein